MRVRLAQAVTQAAPAARVQAVTVAQPAPRELVPTREI
jgi:hypothetical protein